MLDRCCGIKAGIYAAELTLQSQWQCHIHETGGLGTRVRLQVLVMARSSQLHLHAPS
jgi:hypothetical protein